MAEQRLQLSVAQPYDLVFTSFQMELGRAGRSTKVILADDGTTSAFDAPFDGIWMGEARGEHAVITEVVLLGTLRSGEGVRLYAGAIPTAGSDVPLAFQVRTTGESGPYAVRVAAAWPESPAQVHEATPLLAGFLWAVLVIGFVGLKLGVR